MQTETTVAPILFIGGGDVNTRLVLCSGGETIQTFTGVVASSTIAKDDFGTDQWVDHIFASTDPDPSKAWGYAKAEAMNQFNIAKPWDRMGSSKAGLNATLHIVEDLGTPATLDVVCMKPDESRIIDGVPYIPLITAWRSRSDMTDNEKKAFNATARGEVQPPRADRLQDLS